MKAEFTNDEKTSAFVIFQNRFFSVHFFAVTDSLTKDDFETVRWEIGFIKDGHFNQPFEYINCSKNEILKELETGTKSILGGIITDIQKSI